jgi:hypothetical protein
MLDDGSAARGAVYLAPSTGFVRETAMMNLKGAFLAFVYGLLVARLIVWAARLQ